MGKKKYYRYKGKRYIVLEEDLKFKNPATREWEDTVKYKQTATGLVFYRNQEEFYKRFKLEEGEV